MYLLHVQMKIAAATSVPAAKFALRPALPGSHQGRWRRRSVLACDVLRAAGSPGESAEKDLPRRRVSVLSVRKWR